MDINDLYKGSYYKRVKQIASGYKFMYWTSVRPTNKIIQILMGIPPNTEYVMKNGSIVWRKVKK